MANGCIPWEYMTITQRNMFFLKWLIWLDKRIKYLLSSHKWRNSYRMPTSLRKNIVFVHGSGQSHLSYNFLQLWLPEHNELCLEYSTQEDPNTIVKRFKFLTDQKFDGEPIHIISHSYGCLLSSLFADEYKNVESFIALSSPWAGSRAAKWLSLVFRESGLFATTKPGSELLTSISKLKLEFPISNIVSTGTKSSANSLAGMGNTPNDGLLTLETQRAVPSGFVNCETIDLEVSHNELLMSMDVVDLIKEKMFNVE